MVTTVAVFVAEKVLPGITCSGVAALLGAELRPRLRGRDLLRDDLRARPDLLLARMG
jgi:hypothetical protein